MGAAVRTMRVRRAHLVLAAICVAQMTFGEEEADAATSLVVAVDEPAKAAVAYSKIPGMALREDSTVLKNKVLDECKAACTAAPTCRSFSYRAQDKTCLWSVDALSYDEDFVMMTKAKTSTTKKYRTFEGLTYRAKGWLKIDGKSKQECEDACSKSTSCNALSYRHKDMLCLLAPKAVSYAPDFDYFEKKGLQVQAIPLTKEGGAAPEHK